MNKKELSQIFRQETTAPELEHRKQLEEQLLAAYDAKGFQPARRRRTWSRYAPGIAALVVLLTTAQVPASYPVEVGKRITAEFLGDPPENAPEALARTLSDGIQMPRTLAIQLLKMSGGRTVLNANVWGDNLLPDAVIVERIRAQPELANAQISIAPLEGKIRVNVAGLVGHHLFNVSSTPEARERARQELILELQRSQGSNSTVDVQVENDGKGERVRVKVLKPPSAPNYEGDSHP